VRTIVSRATPDYDDMQDLAYCVVAIYRDIKIG
jgi:hypothetical protein